MNRSSFTGVDEALIVSAGERAPSWKLSVYICMYVCMYIYIYYSMNRSIFIGVDEALIVSAGERAPSWKWVRGMA